MKKKMVAALCFAALAGCAGTKFNWGAARSVEVGMTEADLVARMGRPYMVSSRADGTQVWVWSYANGMTGGHQSVTYTLKDGKVATVPVIPASYR